MPTPIRRLTVAQFALLTLPSQLTRKIVAVHLHHTWRPRREDFRGHATIEAMRRVHMEQNGWSDIAQHLTIDPQGGLWTGRNWNWAPASATGHNGTASEGPFMIEMVGDFDAGQDPFDGDQRVAVIQTVAHLMRAFGLKDDSLKFHNQLTNQKSCPGTAIDRQQLLGEIHKIPASRTAKAAQPRPFRTEHLMGADSIRGGLLADNAAASSVPENAAVAEAIEAATREAARGAQRRARGLSPRLLGPSLLTAGRSTSDWSMLKAHVINLAKGELSESGEFQTTPADVEAIVDAIRDYASGTDTPRLMIHAHGGLVPEGDALAYAKAMAPWWRSHGVYPLFFIWETSLLEIIGQFVLGRRDIFDFTSDVVIEGIVKAPGTAAWAGMKESARLAAALDTGEGALGGGRLFARKLSALVANLATTGKSLPVHAVGHSAGAIFHAHFLPALLAEGISDVEHLYFLAPAARAELFASNLSGLVAQKQIKALSMFTMEQEAEEQDHCFTVYRKSLLYLVSHACEGFKRRPILGLHRSLRKDPALRILFGLDADGNLNGTGTAHLHFSLAKDTPENPLTRSLTHGGFDNDPKTMSAVLRRILEVDDDSGIGESTFPFPPLPRTFDFAVPASAPASATAGATAPATLPTPGAHVAPRIQALCIGINTYRERPLAGCVNDARTWGQALAQLGARVDYLFDDAATCEGMKAEIRALVRSGRPGDVLVLQYAGHGGQLPNRIDTESDGFNEALIPVDFDTGALLVDDELADLLRELAPGVAMTLFMDCCHSGTNSRFAPIMRARALAGDKPRFMPLDDDVVDAYFGKRGVRGLSRSAEVSLPGVVHYAACQDHEFAWESSGQGDFTASAAPALVAAVQKGAANETFAAEIAAAVGARNRQHPQLMALDVPMQNRLVLSGLVS
jgi:hypothetical protein